ncbi:hypothetical protein [Vibrio ichthyoenteri]|nr:hypothetical protein [Vibrio ichthyoenteri]
MKNKFICVSFMLAFSTVSLAQDVKFYENNISSIESLKMKLEQLELKKKILDLFNKFSNIANYNGAVNRALILAPILLMMSNQIKLFCGKLRSAMFDHE